LARGVEVTGGEKENEERGGGGGCRDGRGRSIGKSLTRSFKAHKKWKKRKQHKVKKGPAMEVQTRGTKKNI